MAKEIKAGKIANTGHTVNPLSIVHAGKGLGSSTDTVNPYSIRKAGKKIS